MTLGMIIRNYREKYGLSMDNFSEKSGISKAYISLLEKNKHPKTGKAIAPSIQCIKQAADGMNMDFNILFSMLDGDVTLNENVENKTTDSFPINSLEKKIIINYRAADNISKAMVYRALGMEEEISGKEGTA